MAAATKDRKLPNITIKDARLIFKNFSGKGSDYNRPGDRNFNVVLPEDVAAEMKKQGYNVKERPGREEGDEPLRYVQVKISFKGRPPNIVMITSRGKTKIDDPEDLGAFDWADIKKTDLIIGPYEWEVRGATGVSCYVQSLYITVNEDELELLYGDIPDADDGASSGMSWTPNEDLDEG